MSIVRKYQKHEFYPTELIIQTQKQQWVIPNSLTIMKALIQDQAINSKDLQFSSSKDCQAFIKKLLLLAVEDEYKNQQPSSLAKLARSLINSISH